MKGGAPARTGATDTRYILHVADYSVQRCLVNPRLFGARPVVQTPSGSVPWGRPNRQKVSTSRQMLEYVRTGLSGSGCQSERRLTDHQPRCGTQTPGPAAKRCSASDDAYAINDQCERRNSPGASSAPCRPLIGPHLHMESRGEWLTIRAIDKRTFPSSPNVSNTR